MSATHTVTVEIDLDDDGDPTYSLVRFACTGGPEDVCHQWCVEGCEEFCSGAPIVLSGTDVEVVAMAPLAGHRWEPMPPDGSSCRILDWLDASDWQDTHFDKDGKQGGPLRPGTHLIEEEWDGDGYSWTYAEPESTVAA